MSTTPRLLRNVLTLTTGTALAQAIPIAISPILTRIYTPEDFGVFAIYLGIVSIMSSFSSGKFELAIVLSENEKEAINILALTFLILTTVSFILFIITFIFNKEITAFLGEPKVSLLLYLVPVTVFITGLYQVFNYWHTEKKEYKKITINKISQSVLTGISSISLYTLPNLGLILGHLLGQILSVILYIIGFITRDKHLLQFINKRSMIFCIKKHRDFPKYNVFHSLLNNLSVNFPIFLLSHFLNSTYAGFYSLADKVISTPISIIGSSYSQVFYQEVSYLKKNDRPNSEIRELLRSTIFKLFLVFSPLVLIFFFISPALFSFVFGSNWRLAGVYGQILLPMIFLRFIGGIVSPIIIVYKKQLEGFLVETINLIVSFIALLIGFMKGDFLLGLILFSLVRSIISIGRLFWYARLVA